ncbi:MlaD family protein [Candidatus Omnitrophota bacterium]
MKKFANEFKVGMLVVFCLLGLLYLTVKTGKIGVKQEGYFIYALFNEIAGLDTKAPVMLNGLEVGKVEGIDTVYTDGRTQIKLKIWLRKEARVRNNPEVSIKTLGLMGEKYIQIASHAGKGFIEPESTVIGEDYADIDKIIKNVDDLISENQNSISQIIQNLEELTIDLKRHPWKLLYRTREKK